MLNGGGGARLAWWLNLFVIALGDWLRRILSARGLVRRRFKKVPGMTID